MALCVSLRDSLEYGHFTSAGAIGLVVLGANCAHSEYPIRFQLVSTERSLAIIYLQTCALWENNRIVRWFLLSLLVVRFSPFVRLLVLTCHSLH